MLRSNVTSLPASVLPVVAPAQPATPTVALAASIALVVALGAGLGCAPPPKPCRAADGLVGAADQVVVAQGGRTFIAIPKVDGIVVSLAGLAPGFTQREQDGAFVVGAPYDLAGSVPVRMVATCTDAVHDTATHPFTLEVRAAKVERLTDPSAPTLPAPRSLPALTVVGNALVVAGGTTKTNASVDDVWSLDLDSGAWSKLDGVTAPPSPSRAADVDDHTALLLAADGKAYSLDVAARTLGALASAPSTAVRGAFVPASGSFVSFCGVATASSCAVSALVLGDGGGARWAAEAPTGFSPTGRAGVAYGFDDEGARAVLFGGESDDGTISTESWSLDVTHLGDGSVTFNHLATKGIDPPARVDACGVVDPLGRRFFVFGGTNTDGLVTDAWVLDLDHADARWRPVTYDGLPARSGCAAVYDAAHQRILVGFGDDGNAEQADVWAVDL